jgi:methylphosphotriester-DNA--protein-cysteine methyltransferase
VASADNLGDKIRLLQEYLLHQFAQTRPDEIFEFCVREIERTQGCISIRQLEKSTGYSSRWLNLKFEERIGISPKALCAVIRFQAVYQALMRHPESILGGKAYYNFYYDQSHFIREFKRFTGSAPTRFQARLGEFGKIFQKQ